MTIVVEIDGILFEGRRHKLAVSHCAGIRAAQIQRIVLLTTRHQQEGFQFAAEIFCAARIAERERCQRIQKARFAHHPAPACFHANNANDDFRRHAILLTCTFQRILILIPERHAIRHIIRRNKLVAVANPGAVRPGWRRIGWCLSIHQAQNIIQLFRLANHRL